MTSISKRYKPNLGFFVVKASQFKTKYLDRIDLAARSSVVSKKACSILLQEAHNDRLQFIEGARNKDKIKKYTTDFIKKNIKQLKKKNKIYKDGDPFDTHFNPIKIKFLEKELADIKALKTSEKPSSPSGYQSIE